MYSALTILTPPAGEPVDLTLLSKHLRLDQDFDDTLLSGYLTAARSSAETYLGRALLTQTLQLTVSEQRHLHGVGEGWEWGWPSVRLHRRRPIELSRAPVQSINSFLVLDHLGNLTASQPTSAATPSGIILQFSSPGCPAAVGQFVQDLTSPAAIPAGATVLGLSASAGITTVTLSTPVALPIVAGDNILFSTTAPEPAASYPVSAALLLTGGSLYIADLALEPGRIRPDWDHVIANLGTVSWPIQHQQIAFTAGYANPAAIPQPIIQSIMITTMWLYERRGDEVGERPEAAEWLLKDYRLQFFGED
jgi:hypothetical protein